MKAIHPKIWGLQIEGESYFGLTEEVMRSQVQGIPRAEIVIVTSSADLGYWKNSKIDKPLILDVVDGLIGEQNSIKNLLRGYGHWVTRNSTSMLPQNYRDALISVAKKSSAVICSSPEQVSEWKKFNIKAIDIIDFHEEIPEIGQTKTSRIENCNSLFWEGLPATLNSLGSLRSYFLNNASIKFNLNLVTKKNSYRYLNRFQKVTAEELVKRQLSLSNLTVKIAEWDPQNLLKFALASNIGVIPINPKIGYNHLKAENRLLIMWKLGLPVLTSPLESYIRVMKKAGIDGICHNEKDWERLTSRLLNSPDLQLEMIERGRNYLLEFDRLESQLEKWDFATNN